MLLLDTHAALWLDSGQRLRPSALGAIAAAESNRAVFVSPITPWEIGMLVRRGRLDLDMDPQGWFDRFLRLRGVQLTPLTATAAIAASFLPMPFHDDPADRFLVATARELNVPIVTRDGRILEYARRGEVKAIEC